MAYKDQDKKRAYDKEYNRRNAEAVGKTKAVYQKTHRDQANEANRKYAKAHREELREKNYQWRCALRDFVREQKLGKQCSLCGEADVMKLVFHHRDPTTKLFNIGRTVVRSKQVLLEEIAKCDVLCQPCHASLHHRLRKGLTVS